MLKHPDDDGDLSLFASGDEILFACSRGHFWVVSARQMCLPSKQEDSVSLTKDEECVHLLAARFGTRVLAALRD
ncbi:MAG: hypothetical protein JWL64_1935 [Frankiales bacterium]|nr:hypothetical protein [Frankiales bacterium]